MKEYSNSTRKPMMYGGMTKPKKRNQGSTNNGETRAKTDAAANAAVQSRVATGKATPKDKEAMQRQRREDLRRQIKQAKADKDTAALNRFMKAANSPKGDGPIIKGILQEMGMAERAPAPQESSGMMYGGKTKMAMGGKPMAKDPKTGKMMPTYAMDGKGKMMYGGKAKKK